MLEPKLLEQIIDVAAVAAYKSSLLKGKGDKNAADQAAVDAMRQKLNDLDIYGKVVIGDGEMDEAPMLYIGEILGKSKNPRIDIAVDPLDGTKLAANNQPNAISVISISEEGMLLQAPDTYMDKISVGPHLPENIVDLDEDVKNNIKNLARAKNKSVDDICICLLDRERHEHIIEDIKSLGAKLKLISERGERDLIGSIKSKSNIKILYLHAREIIQRLGDGSLDIGFSGFDLLKEGEINIQKKINLVKKYEFGKATLVVAIPDPWIDVQTVADLEEIAFEYRD